MRYIATRMDGAGHEVDVSPDVPLTNVTLVKPLSGPQHLQATLTPEWPGLMVAGAPVIKPWDTCLWMISDDPIPHVVGGGLVKSVDEAGSALTINCVGLSGVIDGVPWTAAPQRIYGQDAGEVFRLVWSHVQTQPGGDVRLTMDGFVAGVTVGYIGDIVTGGLPPVTQTVDAPFVLDLSTDLGRACQDLLVAGGFEYREVHTLQPGGLIHSLDLAHEVGSDLTDRPLEVGVDVTEHIELEVDADDHPTLVIVRSGDITGSASRPGLRKVRVADRENIISGGFATLIAQRILAAAQNPPSRVTVHIADTSVEPGDRVTIRGPRWGGDITTTARVNTITITPGSAGEMVLDLI